MPFPFEAAAAGGTGLGGGPVVAAVAGDACAAGGRSGLAGAGRTGFEVGLETIAHILYK